ncbi:TetR/AcrR family transcriptional regulator [Microbacterium sp. lyk4-40-TSB-66]|uniref:TetR/AcrR family transcriptional regulator n=1 Tax=Microbacterium sp. lyk4-40-TSB-66 TaxID=3040294 RepID=UPI00254C8D40|nr:TetR/AcrR family transcriptional regulator [Microbacterium sp. lyk4-40-TSB-66]
MTRPHDEPPGASPGVSTEQSGPTARDRAKAERRAALLAAAARLFAERGYDGVTLGDIGEAAGVSGPAVYRHVAGKQALLGAILVDVSERLLHGGRGVASAGAPTRDRRADPGPGAPHLPDADPRPAAAAGTTAAPSRGTLTDRHDADTHRGALHPASAPLPALVDFHVAFALAEADVIRAQDRDLDRLSPADRRTVRDLQNAYIDVWTDALARAFPDAETPAERRVRALAGFGLMNSTPYSVRGIPSSRVRPVLARMALAALTA